MLVGEICLRVGDGESAGVAKGVEDESAVRFPVGPKGLLRRLTGYCQNREFFDVCPLPSEWGVDGSTKRDKLTRR